MNAPHNKHEGTVRIRNRLGLHARPAAEFVKLASRFDAEVWVEKTSGQNSGPQGVEVNGKSIMGVMMLAAEAGSSLRIRAEGSDAESAVSQLAVLVRSGFSEEIAAEFAQGGGTSGEGGEARGAEGAAAARGAEGSAAEGERSAAEAEESAAAADSASVEAD